MWHHTSNSSSGNRVFDPRVLDWNQVYETRDAILQFSSNCMLTYDILSSHTASMQIPSKEKNKKWPFIDTTTIFSQEILSN